MPEIPPDTGRPPRGDLKKFHPDLDPTGRVVKRRLFEKSKGRGKTTGSVLREYRLGARKDKRDYNPLFCLATRKKEGGGQCGAWKLRDYAVCAVHGAGAPKRAKEGTRMPPRERQAVADLSKRIKKKGGTQQVLDTIEEALPELQKRIRDLRNSTVDILDLDEDVIHLTALRDAIVAGEIKLEAAMLVRCITAIIDTKAATMKTKIALEAKNMVPVPVMREYVNNFVALLGQFVPQDRQAELLRELRLLSLRAEDAAAER